MPRPTPRPQLLPRMAVLVLVLLVGQQEAAAFLLGPRALRSSSLRPSNAAAAAGASERGSATGKCGWSEGQEALIVDTPDLTYLY